MKNYAVEGYLYDVILNFEQYFGNKKITQLHEVFCSEGNTDVEDKINKIKKFEFWIRDEERPQVFRNDLLNKILKFKIALEDLQGYAELKLWLEILNKSTEYVKKEKDNIDWGDLII